MSRILVTSAIALALIGPLAPLESAFAQDGSNAATDHTLQVPVVTVATASTQEVTARASVSGTLVASEEVLVNTRINGYAVETIEVELGDVVEKGELLATLDDSGAAAQLAQAEAELARSKAAIGQAQGQIDAAAANRREADASLARTAQLRNSGGVSQAALDQAKAASSSARANLVSANNGLDVAKAQQVAAQSQRDLAELNFNRTRITAPVAGIVSARNVRLGEIANGGGEPLFRLIRNGELEVAVEVIETALGGMDVGDESILNVAGVGSVEGQIRLVSPTVDAKTRLGLVRIALTDSTGLRAGLSASGWITTHRRNSVTVPAMAVLTRGGESSVQLVIDGIVKRQPVTVGILSSDGQREILQGLGGGEVVIARAGPFYVDGDKVRALEVAADTSASGDAN